VFVPIAAVIICVGFGLTLLGVIRTIRWRQLPTFRGAVATTLTGTGVAAFGVALLILATGTLDLSGIAAAFIVAVAGVGQLLMATLVRRSAK
jgi:hypothetical protein